MIISDQLIVDWRQQGKCKLGQETQEQKNEILLAISVHLDMYVFVCNPTARVHCLLREMCVCVCLQKNGAKSYINICFGVSIWLNGLVVFGSILCVSVGVWQAERTYEDYTKHIGVVFPFLT